MVESDSKRVVDRLNGEQMEDSYLGIIVDDCLKLVLWELLCPIYVVLEIK